jgi:copper chaperone
MENAIKLVLEIDGMTCGGCVRSVRRVLEEQPGVSAVDVSITPGQASLQYQPQSISPAALCAAINQAGFSSRIKAD